MAKLIPLIHLIKTADFRLMSCNLHLDKDPLKKDDFLGEARVNVPKNNEQETITLPLTGKGTKGNVTVEFFASDDEEYTNCTK